MNTPSSSRYEEILTDTIIQCLLLVCIIVFCIIKMCGKCYSNKRFKNERKNLLNNQLNNRFIIATTVV